MGEVKRMINLLDYVMRGGEHPNRDIDVFERKIMDFALKRFMSVPQYAKKGLRWVYNLCHFEMFYCSQDPDVLKIMYDHKMMTDWIEIETITICDLQCNICENRYWPKSEPRTVMSYEKFLHIMKFFPNLKWIGLTGMGQSFLNKDYLKIIDYCKGKNVYIEIFDSFLHLDREKIEHLVDVGFDKIYVSLDAATKETYQNLRLGSDWDRVVSNVKLLDRIKKERCEYFPELYFHYIITKENVHEVKAYVKFVHDLGVDVRGVQFTKMLHAFPEVKHLHVGVPDDFKREVIEEGEKYGVRVQFNINSAEEQNKPPMSTCTVWVQPFIFVDGTVVSCCSQNEQNARDWQRRVSLGNVFEQDFRSIWYGRKYERLRKDLESGKCPEACERCVLRKVPK
jgi:MoaA/NifB/PqqE/SkfB family radical SAM enzyme